MKTILVIVAHPDDEALGCGGTVARLVSEGKDVHLLCLTNGVSARASADETDASQRSDALRNSSEILGLKTVQCLDLPDNKMDSLPLLDVVQQIESVIADIKPDTIFTHYAHDLNVDHRVTYQAVVTATRPQIGQTVREILMFEVPSSTEWAYGDSQSCFKPNVFFDVSNFMLKKIESLRAYDEEMRDFPHPRSYKAIEAVATVRGAEVGVHAAEGFMLARKLS
ncbi:MAG: GlcNAc-PI de-N-acetylase [Alphaproteobacteria bacterium]|nr:MAG: GlcNAc-PI de-N-acetylase [Alphaproteobacteria bacterium]